ncbi:hypothetical protein IMSAGC020_01334 [Lachnospiraceae bacterium]|jgi:phosphonopyruvate decarboxylase|nr:hypothetical protein IMSAGC020_01334 [Lachnospiraceae bacterium]
MKVEEFVYDLYKSGIETIAGIPDSTLNQFCNYIENEGNNLFKTHIVTENEGGAVGIAIGEYLATGKTACVYMQNSGLGNIVNPVTSLAHHDVYGIPILFLIGWRGEPGIKDEPQHKFMGKITIGMLELLEINYSIIDYKTPQEELNDIFKKAKESFSRNEQFAIVIKPGTFDTKKLCAYKNEHELTREDAIRQIVRWMQEEDLTVSTTGKISRELYEQMDSVKGNHKQVFLTVGGMGHAKMIAYGIAQRRKRKRIICLDGDGAVLMHMGGLAMIGRHPLNNLVHICLDNEAHESVGGMPTGAAGMDYCKIAQDSGYPYVYEVSTKADLLKTLGEVRNRKKLSFIHIKVAIESRENLVRPKESPEENKRAFMSMME